MSPIQLIFLLVAAVEIFAFANRGGGPLLSHLVLTLATFAALLIYVFKFRNRLLKLGLPQIFYLTFFLFFVLSLITSLTPSYGLSELLLFANTILLFILISQLEISENDLKPFSILLVALAVGDTLVGYFIYTHTPLPRFVGTFLDLREPYTSFGNDFANFLLLTTPLTMWMFFRRHARITTTILCGLASAILLSGLLLSFSRGAWISAVGMLSVATLWFAFSAGHLRLWRMYLHRAAALVLLCALLVSGLQATREQNFETLSVVKKLLFQADEGSASAGDRLEFWRGAIELMKERPLLGSGVLSFKYLNPQHQRIFEVNENHPHNIFLKISVENGLPALGAFVLFLVLSATRLVPYYYKRPLHRAAPFLLGALGALAHNLVDFNFIVGNYLFFVLFIAIGLSFTRTSTHRQFHTSITPLLVLSFIFVALGMYEGYYNFHFKKGRAGFAESKVTPEYALQKRTEAVASLEKARGLVFERDLDTYLADAYQKVYLRTKDEAIRQKQRMLLRSATDFGSIDALLYERLGQLQLEEKNLPAAERAFKQALNLDPLNRFRYYYALFEAQREQGKELDADVKVRTLGLLDSYKPMLRENRHFTILSDNPQYAVKLYDLFGMPKDKEEIEFFSLRESLKFVEKYGYEAAYRNAQ